MRIGLLDLDTSHPGGWVPILRDLGHEVTCVHDEGSVHPPRYAEAFASQHGVPRVCPPHMMIDDVDCVIVHSCDWDRHVEKARPFVEAGKSVLIDKPMAGNLSDLGQLQAWIDQGARITGGSALQFSEEARHWLAQPVADRGTPHTVFCGCGVDEFNYGIHAYALLCNLLGSDASSVQHLGQGIQRRVQIKYDDGRCGLLAIGETDQWLPFYASIVTQRVVYQFRVDHERLYRSMLEAVLPYLAGQTDTPPLPTDRLFAPERWALAARQSWLNADREIALDGSSHAPLSLTVDPAGYDGTTFAQAYRQARYPA